MTGQEYHYTCCLSSLCQKQSDRYNQIFFRSTVRVIQTETKRKYTGGISLSLPRLCHGVSVNVAYAHHDNNRNVSDEWICICQGSVCPKTS